MSSSRYQCENRKMRWYESKLNWNSNLQFKYFFLIKRWNTIFELKFKFFRNINKTSLNNLDS